MSPEFAQEATTTTTEVEVQRVVGEHPGNLPVLGGGLVLLVLILLAGVLVSRRASRADAPR
jgi:hypothetical protein